MRNPDRAQWRGVQRRQSNSRVGGRRLGDNADKEDGDAMDSKLEEDRRP